MLIAMAGLPGTGKSTIARALARAVDAVVLDKDIIRAALFPPEAIEYSSEQDDLCVSIMLQVAEFALSRRPERAIILDGHTFSRSYQVEAVVNASEEMATGLAFIECTCAERTALRRLAADRASGDHPAANRDAALYYRVKARAEPLYYPHLMLDTEQPLGICIAQCLAYLGLDN
ncbi:MAG: AAA family ATPase [Anaerolineae bacterium]